MMQLISVRLFWLVIGHCLADYPLQGDFLARAKNLWRPLPDVPWWIAMTVHCLIHAASVALITSSYELAMAEFAFHFLIDVMKCHGTTSFAEDQLMHLVCKAMWAAFPL